METDSKEHLENIRRIALISLLISIYTLTDLYPQYHGMGSLFGTFSGSRLLRMSPVVITAILGVVVLVYSYQNRRDQLVEMSRSIILALRKCSTICWMGFCLIGLVFPILVLSPLAPDFDFMLTRLWIFSHLILLGALLLMGALPRYSDLGILATTALIYAMAESVALHLPEISTQISSMGWSEASRYYYASLYFSDSIYGISAPLSSLHPSRYLLQSIPFLIPGLPLWVHRAWQVFLWLALPLSGSLLIIRRLKIKPALLAALVVIWGYLFLNQGPVYYHLMVCVIIVAAGFSVKKPLQSLVFVILASIWAGISRINWFPVPGLLAVVFYLLEVPRVDRRFWKYWTWPAIWGITGVATAFLAEAAYVAISGNPVENFGTSFTSSLLWYRLFPNTTYPEGVLDAILLAMFPALVLLVVKLGRNRGWIHFERISALLAILVVFFVGGIVVSVKIGGGSNLHNMDAFLAFLLVATVYFYFNRVTSETGKVNFRRPVHWMISATLILLPVINVIQVDANLVKFDNQPVVDDLKKLQEIIDITPVTDGEILFISQRHFITFNYVERVRLFPDYEKVFLMEMAMAGNQAYFDQFERDLRTHRFSLIVSEPLSLTIQDEQYMFSEENNAWTTWVTTLIRKYYHEELNLPNALIVVSEPNP